MKLFWLNRIAAVLMLPILYWYWSTSQEEGAAFARTFMMIIPILLIWNADRLGDATGYQIHRWGHLPFPKTNEVNVATPGIFIKMFGWIFLLGPFILRILFAK